MTLQAQLITMICVYKNHLSVNSFVIQIFLRISISVIVININIHYSAPAGII